MAEEEGRGGEGEKNEIGYCQWGQRMSLTHWRSYRNDGGSWWEAREEVRAR